MLINVICLWIMILRLLLPRGKNETKKPKEKAKKDFFFRIHEFLFVISAKVADATRNYYGAHLGALSPLEHGVSGDVYAVDSRTLFLKNFRYDGEGPGNFELLLLFQSMN